MRAMQFQHAPAALVDMPAALLVALAAFAVTLACLWFLLSRFGRRLMLDRPNERSLHERPVPRSGGIAIAAGVAAGVVANAVTNAAATPLMISITVGVAGVLAVVSLADDAFNLPTRLRLAAHLGASAVVLGLGIGITDPVPFVLLLLAIAWYANLYNFMDGSDGLAGGMAVFGFGAYAWAAQQSGHAELAALGTSVAAASFAFLLVNFHPARLFMGDVGSVPLGFLAGALGVLGWRDGIWPLWFPLVVFAPFVCDATLTLVKRLLRGERVWQAHKDHYYQRLVRMGFGHRGTAWIEYAAMAGCAATALIVRTADSGVQAGAIGAATAILISIAVWVDARWARWSRAQRNSGSAPA
jgi:UDP-N-acetylmuramyl pentapeptide phosphotransferase/UDP-N-acetylglucosamine-1-phosphate transferase